MVPPSLLKLFIEKYIHYGPPFTLFLNFTFLHNRRVTLRLYYLNLIRYISFSLFIFTLLNLFCIIKTRHSLLHFFLFFYFFDSHLFFSLFQLFFFFHTLLFFTLFILFIFMRKFFLKTFTSRIYTFFMSRFLSMLTSLSSVLY